MCEILTTADWIQIIIAVITLIGVLTSTIIAVVTLRQNHKMIEESVRPNVIIYKDILDINSPLEYIVIKNVGSSLAHITSLDYNENELEKLNGDWSQAVKALNFLKDSYLAPNQFYKVPIKTKGVELDVITFNIKYTGTKEYKDSYSINLKQDCGVIFIKQHKPDNELEVISNALQELIKRIS